MSTPTTLVSSSQQIPFDEWPSITEFYTGRDVFITGVTGFMGKCLLEKILRSIPGEGKVFVLVRQKKGKSPQERVQELTSTKLFDMVRNNSPDALERVVPIEGDISQPGLGISKENIQAITDTVSMVFHLAANVNFNVPLREELTYNVLGVREMVKLARKMKKLKSFVHVSTAYCNCQREDIDEIIYSTEVSYDKLLSIMEWMTDEQLKLLTPSLLEGRPNTYTFAKALAENLLRVEASDLPVCIIRPSIIGSSVSEPVPGWIDCFHGSAGIFVAVGKGLLRVMCCKRYGVFDLVPVDYVNNMVMSAGWVTALNTTLQPLVYHCTSGSHNAITYFKLYDLVIRSYYENPFDQIFRRPYVVQCIPNNFWPLYHLVLHLIPGYLADLVFRVIGKKPMLIKLYTKINTALCELHYFTTKDWNWTHQNYDKLLSVMKEGDRETFNFDMTSFTWDNYIRAFCMGTKKYLLNDKLSNLHRARQQIKRFRNVRYTFNFLIFLLVTRVVYLRSRIAREMWSSMLGMCLKWLTKFGIPLLHHS